MAEHVGLDDTDHRILELLQEDARRTVRDIAAAVHLSPAPVKRRIDRMELLGVIVGYTVVLDQSKVEPALEAFLELRMPGHVDTEDVVRSVMAMSQTQEVCTTAGDPDAIVRVRVSDVHELQRFVNTLRGSGMVTATKTLMVLDRQSRMRQRVTRRRPAEAG